MSADFTITIRDTDAGCWITLRGNQTGTTVQRCVRSGNMLIVLFWIGRLWIAGAAKVVTRSSPAPERTP